VRDDRDQSEPIPAGEKGREQQHDERESNKPGNHELCVYRQRILSSSWFFYIKKRSLGVRLLMVGRGDVLVHTVGWA
jgi:hypothetical protein